MKNSVKLILPIVLLACIVCVIACVIFIESDAKEQLKSVSNNYVEVNNSVKPNNSIESIEKVGLDIKYSENTDPIIFEASVIEINEDYIKLKPAIDTLEFKVSEEIYLKHNEITLKADISVGQNINVSYYGGITTTDSGDTYYINEVNSIDSF